MRLVAYPLLNWFPANKNMKVVETIEAETLAVKNENIIRVPLGLLGFERIKQYVLLANAEEQPFLWLQVLDDPKLAFLVVSPFDVDPEYQPDLSAEDTAYLGINDPTDALIYNIVTVRPDGRSTVNLKGPIVMNRQSLVAKQVVPLNAARFALQHPLPVTE